MIDRKSVFGALYCTCMLAVSLPLMADQQAVRQESAGTASVTAVDHDSGKRADKGRIAAKRAQAGGLHEGVDCFYQENQAEPDCRHNKSDRR